MHPTFESLIDQLIKVQIQLDRIEAMLNDLTVAMDMPSIGLRVTRLSSTTAGDDGQVIPGSMILDGTRASDFFKGLGHATVLPLNDLPPWTHMALAKGSWWLIQMG
jgi:hypothetical protein